VPTTLIETLRVQCIGSSVQDNRAKIHGNATQPSRFATHGVFTTGPLKRITPEMKVISVETDTIGCPEWHFELGMAARLAEK
jgi:hypothetical protein